MSTKKFKSNVSIEQGLSLPNKTADRALIINGSNELVESAVTQTELERLSGITTALLETSDVGVAGGVASLDVGGKIPSSQLPAIAITEVFVVADIAARDALTVGPNDGEVQQGDVAIVTDASADPAVNSGAASYIYDGTGYQRLITPDAPVLSVNGETGVVTLDSSEINNSQAVTGNWTVVDGSSIKAHLDEVASRLATLEAAPDSDEFVKVSATDNTAQYLEDKILGSTGSITVTKGSISGDENLIINIGANVFNKATDNSDDIAQGLVNEFFTIEKAQDAVGQILIDSASINFTYDDVNAEITAVALPAGINHDALQNFVANEHIDHSLVEIQTAANSGLSGGGDITATRSLSVDITGTAALGADADDADEVLIYDSSATSLRKVTVAQIIGERGGNLSAGDIKQTSFNFADNQAAPSNVVGLSFTNAVTRSFEAQVSVVRGLNYEVYKLLGVQKGGSWDMSVESVGDDTGITFSITALGQVQYTSTSTGNAGTMNFRADTLNI